MNAELESALSPRDSRDGSGSSAKDETRRQLSPGDAELIGRGTTAYAERAVVTHSHFTRKQVSGEC